MQGFLDDFAREPR